MALFACSKTNSEVSADSAVPTDSASATPTEAGQGLDVQPDAAVYTCITIADDLIADFTTDNSLNPVDGRQGGFYVYGDGSLAGQFDPPNVKCQPYPIDTTTGNPPCSGPGSFHVKARVGASGGRRWGRTLCRRSRLTRRIATWASKERTTLQSTRASRSGPWRPLRSQACRSCSKMSTPMAGHLRWPARAGRH